MHSGSSSSTKRRKMMMIQDDRRIFDDSGLSSLPDDILIRILGFLDTKSSVQTCILSRRWTSLWKDVHVLTFNRISFFYSSIDSFFDIIDCMEVLSRGYTEHSCRWRATWRMWPELSLWSRLQATGC